MTPSNACLIWMEGPHFHLHIPSSKEGGPGHTLCTPYIKDIATILEARREAKDQRLGTPSAPTQQALPLKKPPLEIAEAKVQAAMLILDQLRKKA